MKTKQTLIGILLLLALLISACGGATPQATTAPQTQAPAGATSPPASTGPFRVAVVMPSAINDLAFSQSMYDALTAIQNEMGKDNFTFDYSDNMFVVDDAAAAIRDYASKGYDLVIAHGSQYGSSVSEIAPDFPNTSFAWGTTVDTFKDKGINNVFAYEARSEEGGYVNGVIAASLSKNNVLGVIGPIETGDAKLYVDGFTAGAKATKPDITVNTNYIGSFSDVALASEAANTQISAGADALTGTAQMVVGAIGVAEEHGVPWFGTQSSQTSLAPDIVVANQVYDWTVVLKEIISKVQSGELGGEAFPITLANGGLKMDFNPQYDLPADVKSLADQTIQGIVDGSIQPLGGEAAPTQAPTQAAPTQAPTQSAAGGGEFPFGVVLVGPKNDHGWSQAHYEAGQYVEQKLPGARMIVFESLNPADKPEATLKSVVDDMVAQGAKVIFTTSDEFEEDTQTVAQDYPDITFINVSGDDAWAEGQDYKPLPNEGNFMGRMVDMKAVAGCAAALATQTGKIGYLGPLINFETRRLASSVYLGAKYCYQNYRNLDPADLQFTVTWIGFWFNIPGVTLDPTESTTSFIDSGVDVVLSGIDTTEAIDVAGQRAAQGDQVWAIPYDYKGACDQAPDICLGVPYFNWGPKYLETAKAVQDGTWEPSFDWMAPYWQDLNDPDKSPVGWVNGSALTADMQSQLDQFISGMASGDINVWSGPINLQDGTEYIPAGQAATDQQIWYLPQLLEGMTGPSK
jgi:basic membrane lipoprotein Med (substrate-binding protein (PBP1-ABC) superfamily)